MGPLQRNMPDAEGASLIEYAADMGVNFVDTAEIYDTYAHVAKALKRFPNLVIATKSYAYDRKTAEHSLDKARREMGRDYIDIFLMHEQESEHTIRGHYEALEYYIEMKQKGYIGAVGVSTHYVGCVKAANLYPEIDIVFPIVNAFGYGVMGGAGEDMIRAVQESYTLGKGVFIMKPFGGGNLVSRRDEALKFALNFPYAHSVAVGMQTKDEVLYNVKAFSGQEIDSRLSKRTLDHQKKLFIHDWCMGCGKCVTRCGNGAMSLLEGKAAVDPLRCITCGYCGSVCPEFAIKMI